MRAYRSCASGRCGWRSSPVRATRWAVSSCPLWRNSSPSRRKTRLSGSCASWEDRVLISSGMRPRPGERLGRRLGAAHLFELRQLRLRACSEPFPLVPLFHRLAELQTAYEQARATNPKLTRGQFIAANMLGQNLSDKGITTDKILAGLASGKSMGKTLQSLGLSDKEAKQAESQADRDVKAADKAADTAAPAKPDSGH